MIIVKPAELFLKSEPVMRRMMSVLEKNIKKAVKNKVTRKRIYILIEGNNISKLKKIPGIATITPAIVSKDVKKDALKLAKGLKGSFAVRVNRVDKTIKKTSKELEIELGSLIQKATKAKVNLTKPDLQINIEIHKGETYIFTEVIRGLGGLPVGVSGKVVLIGDSKKAKLMMEKRGCEVIKFRGKNAEKFAEKNGAKALVFGDKSLKLRKSKLLVFTPLISYNRSL